MVLIILRKAALLKTCRSLALVVKSQSKKNALVACELTIGEGKAIFSVPGAVFSLACPTQGSCKANFALLDFYQIIKDSLAKEIEIKVSEGKMQIHQQSLKATTYFFESSGQSEVVEVGSQVGQKEFPLLTADSHRAEELHFNRMKQKIQSLNDNLTLKLNEVFAILKPFGVSYDDLKDFVSNRLYRKDY